MRPVLGNTDNQAEVKTIISTQTHRNADGKILIAMPFTSDELKNQQQYFLGRFSIERSFLVSHSFLLVVSPGKTPADVNDILLKVPVDKDNLENLRSGQAASGSQSALIKAYVKEFDNFVFYLQSER